MARPQCDTPLVFHDILLLSDKKNSVQLIEGFLWKKEIKKIRKIFLGENHHI
jgi:hypothetical protein